MQQRESTDNLRRIRKLEERITQKLRPDLEKAIEQRREVQAELQDYSDLERNLQLIKQQVTCLHLFTTFAALFKNCSSCFCCQCLRVGSTEEYTTLFVPQVCSA